MQDRIVFFFIQHFAMKKLQEKLQEAKAWIQSRITIDENTIALTLGSGLGNFAERVENPTSLIPKRFRTFQRQA